MPRTPLTTLSIALILGTGTLAATFTPGCARTRIWMNEALGQEKRDQLVESVEEARDAQEEAKEEFASALDEFLAITTGDEETESLEAMFRRIETAYERSENRAARVHNRIDRVEEVADALFDEWQDELSEYESDELRRKSESQLEETRERYQELLGAMQEAEAKMDPVLAAFKDQTLFLKHNLNAQAIASLETDLDEIRGEVSELIDEMNASITDWAPFAKSPNCASHSTSVSERSTEYPYSKPIAAYSLRSES